MGERFMVKRNGSQKKKKIYSHFTQNNMNCQYDLSMSGK